MIRKKKPAPAMKNAATCLPTPEQPSLKKCGTFFLRNGSTIYDSRKVGKDEIWTIFSLALMKVRNVQFIHYNFRTYSG